MQLCWQLHSAPAALQYAPPQSNTRCTPLNACLYCNLLHKHEGRNSEFLRKIIRPTDLLMCRDASIVIATRYGLDGPRTESTRGQDFPHMSRPGPNILLYGGYRVSFPRSKRLGRVVGHPLQCGAEVKESRAILLLLWAITPCSRVNFTFTYEPDRTMPYAILQMSHCW